MPPWNSPRRWVDGTRVAALGALLFLAAGLVGCAEPSTPLPPDVLGRWETAEARYADRFFELQSEIVRFGTGGNASEVYSISHVTAEPHPRGELYRVTYLVDGGEVLFAFHHDAVAGVIRLENQPSFEWAKAGAP